MSSTSREFQRVVLSPAYEHEASFTDRDSDLFVDRYGRFHGYPGNQYAHTNDRQGVFCAITADNMLLLNCPPWALDCAEISGGGVKVKAPRQVETIFEAAARELYEETGIVISPAEMETSKPTIENYYMNLFAEDILPNPDFGKTPWLRYNTTTLHFDLSGSISTFEPREAPDGSFAFWQPIDRINDLPVRKVHDTDVQISRLRVGHQHIIQGVVERVEKSSGYGELEIEQ